MIITVQNRRFKVEDGDEIYVEHHFCGRCDCYHTEVTLTRGGKEIAHLGDELTLEGKDEVFGGVIVDKNGNVLPDPHWVTHLLANNNSCMTEDGMYYIGLCGIILDHSPDNEHDRITFLTRLGTIDSTLRQKERDRLCPKCLEVFNDRNSSVGSTKTK